MKFKDLNLSSSILRAIAQMNYQEPTPIQVLTIPEILKKKDMIGLAQTGTGKTAAFALPILDMLIKEYQPDRKIKVLILTPTRELAIQIRNNILDYLKGTTFKCSVIMGGVNQNSQKEVLKKGLEILVATPGRLLDLINQKKADVSQVKFLVLDEADTMLDMGFLKDIKKIISKTPNQRQTMLFSATMSNEIKELANQFMKNPVMIKAPTEEITADNIEQEVYFIDKKHKTDLLLELISVKEQPTTLIFTRTKHGANKLEEQLASFGVKTSVIHGNKTQSNRARALKDFKEGKTKVMIATDIASRGIDIKDLKQVINYDIPEKPEIYVHRIGRTARAGKEGKAISFCSNLETRDFKDIERLIKKHILVKEHHYPKPVDINKTHYNKPNFQKKKNNSTKRNTYSTKKI